MKAANLVVHGIVGLTLLALQGCGKSDSKTPEKSTSSDSCYGQNCPGRSSSFPGAFTFFQAERTYLTGVAPRAGELAYEYRLVGSASQNPYRVGTNRDLYDPNGIRNADGSERLLRLEPQAGYWQFLLLNQGALNITNGAQLARLTSYALYADVRGAPLTSYGRRDNRIFRHECKIVGGGELLCAVRGPSDLVTQGRNRGRQNRSRVAMPAVSYFLYSPIR